MKLNLIFSCCENKLFPPPPNKFCEIVIIPVEKAEYTWFQNRVCHNEFGPWDTLDAPWGCQRQEVSSCCPFSMFFPSESWPATAIGRVGSHILQLLLPPFKDCNNSCYEVVIINQAVIFFFLLTPSIQGKMISLKLFTFRLACSSSQEETISLTHKSSKKYRSLHCVMMFVIIRFWLVKFVVFNIRNCWCRGFCFVLFGFFLNANYYFGLDLLA